MTIHHTRCVTELTSSPVTSMQKGSLRYPVFRNTPPPASCAGAIVPVAVSTTGSEDIPMFFIAILPSKGMVAASGRKKFGKQQKGFIMAAVGRPGAATSRVAEFLPAIPR
jgi:hypothetical protein